MNWYQEDIASAINLAKSKGAVFVVYCEGKDENSKTMTNLINTDNISSKLGSNAFVAVRIESDKPEYIQFCKIYQLVPVPSIFFIKNGVPIKIITSTVKTVAEMEKEIDSITKSDSSSSSSSSSFLREEIRATENMSSQNQSTSASKESEIVCEEPENKVQELKVEEEEVSTSVDNKDVESESKQETEEEKEEKIRRAMKLIEEKRIERIKEEQRLEKKREVERRKEGQEVQKLKKWQDDQELQQLKDERRKEKQEAMEARKRVLDQIEQDKKDRAQRFNQTVASEAVTIPKAEKTKPVTLSSPSIPPNSARIQFKKPDGNTEIVTFDVSMVFGDVYAFVKSDILSGTSIKEFSLATTFPRREFVQNDFDKTLLELNLAPSSVILIIPSKKASSSFTPSSVLPTETNGSFFDMIKALILGLFSPVFALVAYLRNFVAPARNDDGESSDVGKRKRDEETVTPNDAAKKRNLSRFDHFESEEPSTSQSGAIPKSATYKRMNKSSNIHRLHQDSDSEDEERKTYNGNSTQQM